MCELEVFFILCCASNLSLFSQSFNIVFDLIWFLSVVLACPYYVEFNQCFWILFIFTFVKHLLLWNWNKSDQMSFYFYFLLDQNWARYIYIGEFGFPPLGWHVTSTYHNETESCQCHQTLNYFTEEIHFPWVTLQPLTDHRSQWLAYKASYLSPGFASCFVAGPQTL